ncbi:ABC transporter substrate-binding protein [Burkholderia multivorans]|uniref:ABC transporter substrate-binding protein n=1 Tax=Burkholderia multivorans TaxID=87883 RepID=UPI001591D7CB|nr:ABC transporter substrate-binding protein [Burkholderia multivorans]MCA8335846.1 ABC transporter substrate-binding protein [Burkholderia multivorans]
MLKKIALCMAAMGIIAGPASAKDLTSIGVTLNSLGNPFYVSMAKGITDRAKQINPNVKITTVASDYDLNKQFSQIDNFIATKVSLILLTAADPQAILPAVKRAEAAGIPVVALDVTAASTVATVQTDNVKAGEIACRYLSEKLGGKGDVIIMNGPPVSSTIDRVKGCKLALSKGQFNILSDNQDGKVSRDGGLAVGQALMTRFRKFDGMFTVNDQEAIGADLAAKQLKRKGFVLVAVDGSPEIEAALKSDTLIQASAAQNPYGMAIKAVDVGNEIVKTGKPPQNPTILLEPTLVTRDNVAAYKGWGSH